MKGKNGHFPRLNLAESPKFHSWASKFLYLGSETSSNCKSSKSFSGQKARISKSELRVTFHRTCLCIALHHFTAQHVILRSRTPDFQNCQSRFDFLNFSKLIFKTLGFQNYQSFPFYPQDFELQKFFSRKQSGYLDIDFKDFISKLFAKRF